MFHQSRQTLRHSLGLQLRRMKYGAAQPKIFCVGMQKTGTTSLQYALSKLGYRVAGVFSVKDLDTPEQMLDRAMALEQKFDAFADNPWCFYFREFDKSVPGAKFILTTRNPEQWYASVCKHFGESDTKMRRWLYGAGTPIGHKDIYIKKLLDHQEAVRAHYWNRPNDLLEFNVSKGDGWKELCNFLGKKQPREAFPRLNTAEMRK